MNAEHISFRFERFVCIGYVAFASLLLFISNLTSLIDARVLLVEFDSKFR